MKHLSNHEIRESVRKAYANSANGCCGGPSPDSSGNCCVADAVAKSMGAEGCGCEALSDDVSENPCCAEQSASAAKASIKLGYSAEELASLPDGSNLGLGCGNPQAIASIKSGETVLDLGSGAGIDCFLASKATGAGGRVIGVDMTSDMISKARVNAEKANIGNVDFRLGEIENLPVADNSVDVIISNCVINLSPEKGKVFAEAFRVLKKGGRLAASDIVLTAELPEIWKSDLDLYTGCMAGAVDLLELQQYLKSSGFEEIRILPRNESREFIRQWIPGSAITDYVASATIEAVKPGD